ncbi:hypothetical protein N2152v2_007737 [Parachlorella kessleri]
MSKQEAKVFIGGLSWETTDEKLRRYFENYGAVQEAFVSYDRHTGRPRGFGFVVFADSVVADKVISQQHTIDRREVEAKRALPKDESPVSKDQQAAANGHRTKKIFVGGLPPTVDDETFRQYFGEFGEVDDAVVMYDHENKRPRGFGFITFTEEEAVEKVFTKGAIHSIHEKQVEIKRAVPRDAMPPSPRSAFRSHAAYGPPPPHYYGGPPDRPLYGDRGWAGPGERWAERPGPMPHYGGGPPGRGRGGGYGSPHHGSYPQPPYGGYSGRGGGRGGHGGSLHGGGGYAPPPPPPAVVTGIPATGIPANMGAAGTPEAALAAAMSSMGTPGAMATPGALPAGGMQVAMSTPMSAVMPSAAAGATGATPMGIHTPSPLQAQQLVQGFSSLSNGAGLAAAQNPAAAAGQPAAGYSAATMSAAAAAAALDAQQQAVAAQSFADAMQHHASSLGDALSQHLQQQQAAAAAAIWS